MPASTARAEIHLLRFDGIKGVPASETKTRSDHSAGHRQRDFNNGNVELTANLNIPAYRNGYDIEAWFAGDIFESGTLTAAQLISGRIRMTNAVGTLIGASAVLMLLSGERSQIPTSGSSPVEPQPGPFPSYGHLRWPVTPVKSPGTTEP